MTEEYYQSLQAEYKDFVDTCCETYPIFRNWASFMTWADKIEQKISNLEAELAEWREDAERFIQLANFNNKKAGEYFELHERLVKKYEVTK